MICRWNGEWFSLVPCVASCFSHWLHFCHRICIFSFCMVALGTPGYGSLVKVSGFLAKTWQLFTGTMTTTKSDIMFKSKEGTFNKTLFLSTIFRCFANACHIRAKIAIYYYFFWMILTLILIIREMLKTGSDNWPDPKHSIYSMSSV